LAKALQGAPVLNNLEILDLSMGTMNDEGAEALLINDILLKLKYINCRHHYISEEMQQKLKDKFGYQKINLEDKEEADEWDGKTHYYVEIGE